MHEPDVDELLRRLTPEQLRKWRAAYRAVPLGDSWDQTDTICRTIHDANERNIAARSSRKIRPDDLSQVGDYIPYIKTTRRGAIRIDHASIAAHQRSTEANY